MFVASRATEAHVCLEIGDAECFAEVTGSLFIFNSPVTGNSKNGLIGSNLIPQYPARDATHSRGINIVLMGTIRIRLC